MLARDFLEFRHGNDYKAILIPVMQEARYTAVVAAHGFLTVRDFVPLAVRQSLRRPKICYPGILSSMLWDGLPALGLALLASHILLAIKSVREKDEVPQVKELLQQGWTPASPKPKQLKAIVDVDLELEPKEN
jgi:hypothetical protein